MNITLNGLRLGLWSLIFLVYIGCSSPALDDYSAERFELINHNGESVVFPDDFEGNPLLMGFIYTHCPDICSFITANLGEIAKEYQGNKSVQFILVTFDPERDTPDVLNEYAAAFKMDREPFQFLTGETKEIESLMQRMNVRVQETDRREREDGSQFYFLNHSDKILLIDEQARLIFDYGGSMTPVNIIVEDLEKL